MGKRVLAVDDSATVRQVVQSTLENAGYQVVLAQDGAKALGVLNQEEDRFDMVLTDLNMPNLNGIELIREIRATPHHRFIPVLMLTSEDQADLKKAGKLAGASCWLNKPFKPENLLSIVKMVLPA